MRPRILPVVVVAALALALAPACDGSDGKSSTSTTRSRRTTTTSTTSPSGSSTTVPPPSSSTTVPETTTTTAAPGTCGGQTATITEAIQGSDELAERSGQYTVQHCRIAASSPIWAAADVVPNPGVGLERSSVLVERIGSIWTVVALGTDGVGCQAPAPARVELLLPC
jgi:hypothetical protein